MDDDYLRWLQKNREDILAMAWRLIHSEALSDRAHVQQLVKTVRSLDAEIQLEIGKNRQRQQEQEREQRKQRNKAKRQQQQSTHQTFYHSAINCSLASVAPPWQWSWGDGFVAFSDMRPMPRFHPFDEVNHG